MPVAEAQQRISSAEFTEWAAYARIDPFDRGREDMRTAIVAYMIAAANRSPGSILPDIRDFMAVRPPDKASDADAAGLERLRAILGGSRHA